MNIFEIISNDERENPSTLLGINHGQKNWAQFRNVTHSLLNSSNRDGGIEKGRWLWEQIIKNSPQIINMSRDFHLFKLQSYMEKTVLAQTQNYPNIIDKINIIARIVLKQSQFIEIFRNDNSMRKFRSIVKNILQGMKLKDYFSQMLHQSFKNYCQGVLKQQINLQDNMVQYVSKKCKSATQLVNYLKIKQCFENLDSLNLLEEYLTPNFNIFNEDLNNFIHESVDLSNNSEFHKQCLRYQRMFQKNFLLKIVSPKTQKNLEPFISSLDKNTYLLCAKYCCGQILDIILDFPDSFQVIVSLKECLNKTNFLHEIADELVKAIEKRLLIPGVITQNILNQYINILKVLQIIDPHGFVFNRITFPIKNYLLKRKDTLRCIISYLTQDIKGNETKQNFIFPSLDKIDGMSSEEDNNEKWQEVPERENKGKVRVKYQESDLVSVLVNLYGSQEAFFNEYQNMLAQKLMTAKQYSMQEEKRKLQLLKIRFGQTAFETCNIIMKDVQDSKKLDKQIHNLPSHMNHGSVTLKQMNCLAVSKGYWPINYDTPAFFVPATFKNVFDEYARKYSQKKAMRKIQFHYNLGNVDITLSFDNGNFNFKCMPIHAMMISYFDDAKMKNKSLGVSSEQLSSELNLPQNAIKQKMSFWVHKGVIRENRLPKQGMSLKRINSFEDGEVVYYKPVDVYHDLTNDEIEDDLDDLYMKENTSMESHLGNIIQGLIISILNINGPKSPQKIHLLLKTIYKTDLDYTYGQAQTLQILKKMTTKKKIYFNGETYSSKSES